MSNLVPFSFESHQVRVLVDDLGATLFVAKDVATALGYANTSDAIKSHCKGVAESYPLQTAGGMQEARVIREADLYRLIFGSTLPSAQEFERMVVEEILPSIRKTGKYEAPAATPKGDDPRIAALKLSSLAMQAARAFGFKGNHAALSADQAIKTLTGTSPLALLGHAHLVADARGQTYGLNELGQMLDPPISGVVLGKKLAEAGLRAKDEVGNWMPTDAASGLFEWMDTAKRHNGGTPVKQVKWFRDVLTRVQ